MTPKGFYEVRMEHVVTFFMLVSLLLAVVLATTTLVLQREFCQKTSVWFGVGIIGLGCFIMEILVFRYGNSIGSQSILVFSKLWAIAGAILLTLAMPRLAWFLSGSLKSKGWWVLGWGLPAATALTCLGWLLGFGDPFVGYFIQLLFFGTVITTILHITLQRPRTGANSENRFLVRILVWSALCLPLIILDAIGIVFPQSMNDLPIIIFLHGFFLIAIAEALRVSRNPLSLKAETPNLNFLKQYKISNREAEVIALVLEGVNNTDIGLRLFISSKTVENHVTSIFRKTGVKNRIQLYRLINSSSAYPPMHN